MAARPRVLFYVQHLWGIGHVARASRIAEALVDEGFDVTVANGGIPVPGFPGPRVHAEQLPPLSTGAQGFAVLADAAGQPANDDYLAGRRAQLLATFDRVAPQVLIVEAFPFGRRKLAFELLPLLERAHARHPRPLVACSVRDILQEHRKPGSVEETVARLERWFDLVLVHGDRRFAALEETFPLAHRIADRFIYTGFVVGPPPRASSEHYDVVVSSGSGMTGVAMLRAALDARPLTRLAEGRWCMIGGPKIRESRFADFVAEAPPNVSLFRFREDFPALLAAARVSVSRAGYNTVADILQAGCRAVLLPFDDEGETEQKQRAARLAALGRVRAIIPEALTPAALAAAIDATAADPDPDRLALDLDGAPASARILRERLAC